MDLYDRTSYDVSQLITEAYSTSFSSSTKRFSKEIRPHIYAIYGLVRIADEVVDTYRGTDAQKLLDDLEKETITALQRGYSNNPAIHAFALTANKFGITADLIHPFFVSMSMDTVPRHYDQLLYETYIYGSAEVVGLMCLKVFVQGDATQYDHLEQGARALGAAYQKINFLRDLAADYSELGRLYFPDITIGSFDDTAKETIITDIENDIKTAEVALASLPLSSRRAVRLSTVYYRSLLQKLRRTPAEVIKHKRIRISGPTRFLLLLSSIVRERHLRAR